MTTLTVRFDTARYPLAVVEDLAHTLGTRVDLLEVDVEPVTFGSMGVYGNNIVADDLSSIPRTVAEPRKEYVGITRSTCVHCGNDIRRGNPLLGCHDLEWFHVESKQVHCP
jgi:hypothetical protein